MDVKLLNEISKDTSIDPIRPAGFGFTVAEFQRKNHIGRLRAEDLLDELVDVGALEKKLMRYKTGNEGMVYYKPGTWEEIK